MVCMGGAVSCGCQRPLRPRNNTCIQPPLHTTPAMQTTPTNTSVPPYCTAPPFPAYPPMVHPFSATWAPMGSQSLLAISWWSLRNSAYQSHSRMEQWEKWGGDGAGADGEGGQSRLVPCPATKRAYCMPQPPPSPLAPTKHNMQHGPLTLLINPSCLLPAITAASTPVRLRGPPASNTTWPPSPDVTYPLTPCVCTTHCDICR